MFKYIEKVESNELSLLEALENYFHERGVFYDDFKKLRFNPVSLELESKDQLLNVINRDRQYSSQLELESIQKDLCLVSSQISKVIYEVLEGLENDTESELSMHEIISDITDNYLFKLIILSELADEGFVLNFLYFVKEHLVNFITLRRYISLTFAPNFPEKFNVIKNSGIELDENNLFLLKPFIMEFESDIPLKVAINFYSQTGDEKFMSRLKIFFENFDERFMNLNSFYLKLSDVYILHWKYLFDVFLSLDSGFDYAKCEACIFKYFRFSFDLSSMDSFKTLLKEKGPFYPSSIIDLYNPKETNLDIIFNETIDLPRYKVLWRFLLKSLK